MQRLLDDANAYNAAQGKHTDYQIENYADIVEAINTVQEAMGIAGATQTEAATTIQGSIAMMKASWQNLVTSFAIDNADLSVQIEAFVNSVGAVASNVIPRIGVAAKGASDFLVVAMTELIPKAMGAIGQNLPQVMEKGGEIVAKLAAGLIKAIPQIIKAAPSLIAGFVQGLGAGTGQIILAGADLIKWLIKGVDQMITNAVRKAEEILNSIAGAFRIEIQEAKTWGRDLIANFISGMTGKIGDLANSAKNVAKTIWNYLHFTEPEIGPLSDFHTYAPDMMELFAQGIQNNTGKVVAKVNALAESVRTILTGVLDEKNMMKTMYGNMADLWVLEYDNNNPEMQAANKELAEYNALLKVQGDIVKNVEKQIDSYIDAQRRAVREAEAAYNASGSSYDLMKWNNEKIYLRDLLEGGNEESYKKYANDEAFKLMQTLSQEKSLYAEIEGVIADINERIAEIEEVATFEKTRKNLESLVKQQEQQAEAVAAAEEAYARVVRKYGEGSTQAIEFRNALFDEKIEFQELTKEIQTATLAVETYNRAMQMAQTWGSSSYASRSVSFGSSSMGAATAASINSSEKYKERESSINLTANLTTGDGKALASWLLNDIKAVAKAEGTPITA